MTATASAGSIKLPSPVPAVVPASAAHVAASAIGQRSRLSQQVQMRNSPAARGGRRVATSVGPDADEDAEGEEDMEEDAMEEGGDTEDKELYCFCRKLSYGEVRTQLSSASFFKSAFLATVFFFQFAFLCVLFLRWLCCAALRTRHLASFSPCFLPLPQTAEAAQSSELTLLLKRFAYLSQFTRRPGLVHCVPFAWLCLCTSSFPPIYIPSHSSAKVFPCASHRWGFSERHPHHILSVSLSIDVPELRFASPSPCPSSFTLFLMRNAHPRAPLHRYPLLSLSVSRTFSASSLHPSPP